MTTPLVYLAHPVGHGPERDASLVRARRWLAYLIATYEDRAFVMPWLAYCLALDETPANRARGIRDDLAVLDMCDEIWLVGGVLSPGMSAELARARALRLRERDLLHLGAEPPGTDGGVDG